MIKDYFQKFQGVLASCSWVESLQIIRYEMLEASDETILLYRFRIRLKNGDLLEMMERLVQKNRESHFLATTYSFHWQTGEGQLIKRWDNAPHFPNLPGFPHHIHDVREDVVKQGKGLSGLEILETLNGEFDKT